MQQYLGQKNDRCTGIQELKVDPILMQVLLTSNFFFTTKRPPFAVWLPKTLKHKVLYAPWASFFLLL
jgi:ribosomal protein L11